MQQIKLTGPVSRSRDITSKAKYTTLSAKLSSFCKQHISDQHATILRAWELEVQITVENQTTLADS